MVRAGPWHLSIPLRLHFKTSPGDPTAPPVLSPGKSIFPPSTLADPDRTSAAPRQPAAGRETALVLRQLELKKAPVSTGAPIVRRNRREDSSRRRCLARARMRAGHLHDHFHVAAGRNLALGRDRDVGLLGFHRPGHRHVDRLAIGGAGARNVDLSAGDLLLGPGAFAAAVRPLGEFGRNVFLDRKSVV